jgi:hypothetical protein
MQGERPSGRVKQRPSELSLTQSKDSIMPAMTSLMTAKECMDTLVNLYEKKAPSQKRTLKHKLKYLKMEKGDSVASFLFQNSPDQRSSLGHRCHSG